MAEQPQESSDKNVEIWKIKKLIKSLEAARGSGFIAHFLLLIIDICSFSSGMEPV